MEELACLDQSAYVKVIGVSGLSAHDLRDAWATRTARNGAPQNRLRRAGGWSSRSTASLSPMLLRYVEAARVANAV